MSIDVLQTRIRKLKNPSMFSLDVPADQIPPHLYEQEATEMEAVARFGRELLEKLKDTVPAVYFDLDAYALGGSEKLDLLKKNLAFAKSLGYYVVLQYAGAVTARDARRGARALLATDSPWEFDGLLISGLIGADGITPFAEALAHTKKDLFVTVRTGNKSAGAVQDLMTGGRVVHMATADLVSRAGKPYVGKFGYSRICGVGPATSADSLKNLRTKYKDMFLLIQGYDNPAANAKICANAFDKLGYGAVVLSEEQIAAAWTLEDAQGERYLELALEAAERMKKNITRYITIF